MTTNAENGKTPQGIGLKHISSKGIANKYRLPLINVLTSYIYPEADNLGIFLVQQTKFNIIRPNLPKALTLRKFWNKIISYSGEQYAPI